MTESPLVDSVFAVLVFSPGDDLIACLNKAMAFLTVVASSRFPSTNNQHKTSSNPRNQTTIQDGRKGLLNAKTVKVKDIWLGNALSLNPRVLDSQAVQTIIPNNAAFQTEDLDTYDFDCDDISNAKAVLMTNISNYGSDVISEVTHSEAYLNDIENQGYKNPFYLKKAQQNNPALYDGIVISAKHVVMTVIDDEETLILEEESRSKMSAKEKDPEAIKRKFSNKPID
nr:hypothetical protein [Tanacetum cinerariifolium]